MQAKACHELTEKDVNNLSTNGLAEGLRAER
jgi:hypothetical protein